MQSKQIKINRYYNKKGNSYNTIDEQGCLDIICQKLKVQTNPKMDDCYIKHTMNYLSIEKQVKEQYNCNYREITFNITL